MRFAFTKHNGSLGEPGSVAWIFEKRGVVVVDGGRYGEDDLIAAIDAGAEDVREDGDLLRVLCDPSDLDRGARGAGGGRGRDRVRRGGDGAEEHGRGKGTDAEPLLSLLDALDEQDDVDEVHANFDIPEEVLRANCAARKGIRAPVQNHFPCRS